MITLLSTSTPSPIILLVIIGLILISFIIFVFITFVILKKITSTTVKLGIGCLSLFLFLIISSIIALIAFFLFSEQKQNGSSTNPNIINQTDRNNNVPNGRKMVSYKPTITDMSKIESSPLFRQAEQAANQNNEQSFA